MEPWPASRSGDARPGTAARYALPADEDDVVPAPSGDEGGDAPASCRGVHGGAEHEDHDTGPPDRSPGVEAVEVPDGTADVADAVYLGRAEESAAVNAAVPLDGEGDPDGAMGRVGHTGDDHVDPVQEVADAGGPVGTGVIDDRDSEGAADVPPSGAWQAWKDR